jgi:hypothetical protein
VKKRWSQLSPRTRRAIVVTGTIEGGLKLVALRDLRRRPAEQVRGSKKKWATALVFVNSGGALPLAYFLRGRRRTPEA